MKGISPMIAIVLLIAFTVAIGGIMSVWLTGLTSTQTQQVSNQSAAQVKCTPSMTIDLVQVPSAFPNKLNITISNPSQQTISSLSYLVPNNQTAANISVGATGSLTAGSVATLSINVSAAPTFVRVGGLCAGLPISSTCDNTQSCWQTG